MRARRKRERERLLDGPKEREEKIIQIKKWWRTIKKIGLTCDDQDWFSEMFDEKTKKFILIKIGWWFVQNRIFHRLYTTMSTRIEECKCANCGSNFTFQYHHGRIYWARMGYYHVHSIDFECLEQIEYVWCLLFGIMSKSFLLG